MASRLFHKLKHVRRGRSLPANFRYLVGRVFRKSAEEQRIRGLSLADYRPVSQLIVSRSYVRTPRFPAIDAHNHLGERFGGSWDSRPVSELLDVLDEVGVDMLVDLDGAFGEDILNRHLDHFKNAAPDRFQVFCGVDWSRWEREGDSFGSWAAQQLEYQVRRGGQGLKVWKQLGLSVRDQRGVLVPINDERLTPLWECAAQLSIPVTVHIADPVAFFDPVDKHNERYEELRRHPDWSLHGLQVPSFGTLIDQFADLVTRHPATIFIGAHVGCYAENLGWVSALMDRCPNLHVDISGRLAELGRQPFTSRRFFLRHSDRILFGTDLFPQTGEYRIYYRFLETDDEYFEYSASKHPPNGRWNIYGIDLPDEVLVKVYYQNARRILARD